MKIVLAYSGGLDTSVALKWLQINYQAEVIAFCANIGQPESFAEIETKALAAGASKVIIDDCRSEYLRDFVFKALQAGGLYEGRYLMAAPLGRPLIAKRLVEIAHQEQANAVAHGSTGKGTDQVRFYSGVVAHDPELQIIAPAIEWELKSRVDEIKYAQTHGVAIPIKPESPYSMDGSLWGTSTECGCIDDYGQSPPSDAYQITKSPFDAKDEPTDVCISFEQGIPVKIDGIAYPAIELVEKLNYLGGASGVGRVDIVENSLLGIKSRAIYESPAGTILYKAHRELEDLVLDRDTLHFKTLVAHKYAELVYYGLWFSPLRHSLQAMVDHTQSFVTGEITLRLYKGNVIVLKRESQFELFDHTLSSHDDNDRFDHPSGVGFAYIWSMPLRIASHRANQHSN
ncbi:MAG: argininosuccinate synthase [Cyanobacteria bacterium J06621_12]